MPSPKKGSPTGCCRATKALVGWVSARTTIATACPVKAMPMMLVATIEALPWVRPAMSA